MVFHLCTHEESMHVYIHFVSDMVVIGNSFSSDVHKYVHVHVYQWLFCMCLCSQVDYRSKTWTCNFCLQRNAVSTHTQVLV